MARAMKVLTGLFLLSRASAEQEESPINKVLQLLSDLQAKIIREGEDAQKTYSEFSEWCEERSRNLEFEIKTGKSEVAELKASIDEETALMNSLDAKLDELAASTQKNEADLAAAVKIRDQESADFKKEEKELTEIVSMLERAIVILEREMQKSSSLLQQEKKAYSLASALEVLVQASALNSAEASQLTAFVQANSDDEDLGAPAAAVYKGQSEGIIGTLEDLLDKAHVQLNDARNKETSALHNFEMLKQSLEDEIKFNNKEMSEAKTGLAESSEKKATAQGDLKVNSKELKEDQTVLGDLHHNCLSKAQDYEAETKSRGEELKALAAAKSALQESTSGAEELTYGLNQVSFLQHNRLSSASDLANFEAVRFIRDLARKQHSPALSQLAARMASATQTAARSGEDPFGKVRGMIREMLEKLQKEAGKDAEEKAFCDKNLAETNGKKEDKEREVEKLDNKIDQMTSRSQQLKSEVAALQKGLAELAKSQLTMDKMRQKEKAAFTKNKAEMEQGLAGVKMALKILREYYAQDTAKAHNSAEGAGSGLIGLLEVVESDFAQGIVEMTTTEEASKSAYEQETSENEIEKATKEQDVKYKSKESTELDTAKAEASSDREGILEELSAVKAYLKSLEGRCIAKAETFEERRARYKAELDGLREALKILEGEAVLLQREARGGKHIRAHSS